MTGVVTPHSLEVSSTNGTIIAEDQVNGFEVDSYRPLDNRFLLIIST
jgi:hypothetical protein